MTQTSLTQFKGFKKKSKDAKVAAMVEPNAKMASSVLPERLVGKIKACEFCGTTIGVQIIECMYLCLDCFWKYGEAHSYR